MKYVDHLRHIDHIVYRIKSTPRQKNNAPPTIKQASDRAKAKVHLCNTFSEIYFSQWKVLGFDFKRPRLTECAFNCEPNIACYTSLDTELRERESPEREKAPRERVRGSTSDPRNRSLPMLPWEIQLLPRAHSCRIRTFL